MVGGHRVDQLHLDGLVGGRAERPLCPGRVRVTVDGVERLILGRVGDGVGVGGGPHRGHAVDHGHRLGVTAGAGEDGQRFLGRIGHQWGLVGLLHVAVVVDHGAPRVELLLVGVGQHQDGTVLELAVEARPVTGEGGRVEDGGVGRQQASRGGLDQSLTVPGDDQGVRRGLRCG